MFSGCFVVVNTIKVLFDMYLTILGQNEVKVARFPKSIFDQHPLRAHNNGTNNDVDMKLGMCVYDSDIYHIYSGFSEFPPKIDITSNFSKILVFENIFEKYSKFWKTEMTVL